MNRNSKMFLLVVLAFLEHVAVVHSMSIAALNGSDSGEIDSVRMEDGDKLVSSSTTPALVKHSKSDTELLKQRGQAGSPVQKFANAMQYLLPSRQGGSTLVEYKVHSPQQRAAARGAFAAQDRMFRRDNAARVKQGRQPLARGCRDYPHWCTLFFFRFDQVCQFSIFLIHF